ncbi:hypothetical protein [Streptomyces violaceus]|uniref:Uncharacterized protein n=1 Tax=Streptomyces violaceus TaxID=1936 RepID=A0ABY9UMF6_STRVL|nr:hypothetical protein [Streptomyces janthinus]WND24084.1 hypothetical protein RI060_42965 [Streptomyces janthinus]GGS96310.1 hypothetical protein GCM10010270_80340 [Streptomyces janthinus]
MATANTRTQADEALRRTVAAQIGPRRPGIIYRNVDGLFLVVDVQTEPDKARRMLNRRSAQFAVVVINLIDDRMLIVGSTWTSSDHIVHAPGAVTV